jgi:DNA-binding transcriptional MerR regulator
MEEVDPAAPPSVAELPSRLTRAELAQLWRVSLRTIERYEAAGIGPQPIRVGGRVLYRRDDVLAFEQAQIDRAAG